MRHASRSTVFSPISARRASAVDGSSAVGVPGVHEQQEPVERRGDRLDRVEVRRLAARRLRASHRHQVLDAKTAHRVDLAVPVRPEQLRSLGVDVVGVPVAGVLERAVTLGVVARETGRPLHHPAVVLALLVRRRKTVDADLLGRDADQREAVLDHARRLRADREVVLADRDVVPHHDDGAVERVGAARPQHVQARSERRLRHRLDVPSAVGRIVGAGPTGEPVLGRGALEEELLLDAPDLRDLVGRRLERRTGGAADDLPW